MIQYIFIFFISILHAHSIVFVHIGKELPDYLPVAIDQAMLFNEECPIYVIGNSAAFAKAKFPLIDKIHWVSCETLHPTDAHKLFRKKSTLNKSAFEGFWTYTSERFFYLEELIRQYNLTDVFHLENDVMIYTELAKLLPVFQKHYRGKIGATFDNDARCIPGFVYISDLKPIKALVKLMAAKASESKNDMEMLQEFKKQYDKVYIDHLPILMKEYKYKLMNAVGATTKSPERYKQHFEDFHSIFDAAAIGQYLGGISPRNGEVVPGFINESCLFNPAVFDYDWEVDSKGRFVPFIQYNEFKYPINNLHIHSKNLINFHSKRF